jgi:hypothetical protein
MVSPSERETDMTIDFAEGFWTVTAQGGCFQFRTLQQARAFVPGAALTNRAIVASVVQA